MNVLALVTDAYGGRGGIAAVNRMALRAIAAHDRVEEVHVLPRLHTDGVDAQPAGVRVWEAASRGKLAHVRAVARASLGRRWDLVVCGHLHLLPLALAVSGGAPTVLVVHGIEAWRGEGGASGTVGPAKAAALRPLTGRVHTVVAVSGFSLGRYLTWARPPRVEARVVPNGAHLERYSPGPKPAALLHRYGLHGKTVLMTICRLAASERYKGVDEVLEALGPLRRQVPDVAYIICGDGDDRLRLETKARSLGLAETVTFAGYVPEREKADHYRLADVFAMPSRGEGFGLVYLEALASGVPVVAGNADGAREVLQQGHLGVLVDPASSPDVCRGIVEALGRPRGVPAGLEAFSEPAFRERWRSLIDDLTPVSVG